MTNTDRKRVIVVTGASRGLGKEIALRFGKARERVVVNYLESEQAAVHVAGTIAHYGGEAMLFRADVSSSDDVGAMIDSVETRWGTIDVLVNNAGMTKDGLIVRMTEEDWDSVLNTNLAGPFRCIRAVSGVMSKSRKGHIINIASIVGIQGREGQAHYSSSKAGLVGLTKSCAKELGCSNIKVNVILPGYLATDMGNNLSDTVRNRIIQENALGRIADTEEVAEFIYQLSLTNNVSGQVFNLDSRVL